MAVSAKPAGITAALTYMQRRYGGGLTIHTSAPASQTLPKSENAEATSSQGCTFTLTIQPTDPAWDAKELHSLKLQGLLSADYPKPESYSICVDPQQNCLSNSAASVANQLIAAEGRLHAGRPGALQQLLRYVDNRAAMLFHEAEDIVLEAAQKRRQAHSQAQKSAGNQPVEEGTLQQPSRQGQAPPPPPQTENSESAESQVALPGSADVDSSGHRHTGPDLAADLAADLGGMLVSDEARDAHRGGVGASEQDSDGYWSESQWDSSASYAGRDQQTSDSDHQHDSSDAEHAPQAGVHSCLKPHALQFDAQHQVPHCRLEQLLTHCVLRALSCLSASTVCVPVMLTGDSHTLCREGSQCS